MKVSYIRAIRSFRRDVVYYLIAWFLVQFCFSGVYAVLMNLYVLRLGYGPAFVGTVQATMGLGFAVFALIGGGIGRRLGYRRAIILGLSCNVVFSAIIPLSVFFSGHLQRFMLLAPYGLYGLCLTFIIVNGVAFLANTTESETRPIVFGIYASIPPVAGFAGSLVAGFLPVIVSKMGALDGQSARTYGFSLWIVTILYAVTLAMFLRSRETQVSQTSQTAQRPGAPVAAMLVMLFVAILRSSPRFALIMFFNAYLDTTYQTATPLIGTLMSIARLIAAPAALMAPLIMTRLGSRRTVMVTGAVFAFLVLPIAIVSSVPAAAFSLITVNAAATMCQAAYMTFHQEITHPLWRSIMAGAVFTAGGLSYAAVGYGGGAAIEAFGYQRFFLFAIFAVFAGLLIFWRYFTPKRTQELSPAEDGQQS